MAQSDDGVSAGLSSRDSVVGLVCTICQRHRSRQRNSAGTWTDKPCTHLRKDMLQRHQGSDMHRRAEEMETTRLASLRDGGIVRAFSARVSVQRKALVGALRIVYWLAKEEVAHTTKFKSPMDLAIELGSNYLRELHLGGNAHYTSEQAVSELLQYLSTREDSVRPSVKPIFCHHD